MIIAHMTNCLFLWPVHSPNIKWALLWSTISTYHSNKRTRLKINRLLVLKLYYEKKQNVIKYIYKIQNTSVLLLLHTKIKCYLSLTLILMPCASIASFPLFLSQLCESFAICIFTTNHLYPGPLPRELVWEVKKFSTTLQINKYFKHAKNA